MIGQNQTTFTDSQIDFLCNRNQSFYQVFVFKLSHACPFNDNIFVYNGRHFVLAICWKDYKKMISPLCISVHVCNSLGILQRKKTLVVEVASSLVDMLIKADKCMSMRNEG